MTLIIGSSKYEKTENSLEGKVFAKIGPEMHLHYVKKTNYQSHSCRNVKFKTKCKLAFERFLVLDK